MIVETDKYCFQMLLKKIFISFYSLAFYVNRKNYGITIKELDQPLLIHRPKERSRPGGKVKLMHIKGLLCLL